MASETRVDFWCEGVHFTASARNAENPRYATATDAETDGELLQPATQAHEHTHIHFNVNDG